MDDHVLSNVIAYSAQMGLVAAGGALLLWLLRIEAPAVRYAWWRALLGLCLLLPWIQGRDVPVPAIVAPAPAIEVTFADVEVIAPGGATTPWTPDWALLVVILFAGGAFARFSWVGLSLVRLRRLRRMGAIVELESDDVALQERLGTNAAVREVPGLRQPVTFGWRRPVVLVPESLRAQPPAIRRAVLCHELLHVQRRDWIWVIAEEGVRAIFWFHPAIWWMVSRIQLAREEVVDSSAIAICGSRRSYIEALLAFADGTPLATAPAFLRRRHLFRRILLISKERAMSSRRTVISCFCMAGALAGGGWYAVHAFPLRQSAAPALSQPGALAGEAAAIPARAETVLPDYPPELAGMGLAGHAIIQFTVDGAGRVTEATAWGAGVSDETGAGRIGGAVSFSWSTGAFGTAAEQAVRSWRYEPPGNAPVSMGARFEFAPDRQARLVVHDLWNPSRFSVVPPPPPPPPPPDTRENSRVSEINVAPESTSPAAAPSAAAQTRSPSSPVSGRAGQVSPPPTPPAPREPIRVGGNITAPKKIVDVKPVYPAEAQAKGVQGIVIVEAVIDEQGRVTSARAIRSIPLLDQAALDAVRQWQYTPTHLNGNPIPLVMSVTVNFTLEPTVNQLTGPADTPIPLRIGGNFTAPAKTKHVPPVYPPAALAAQVSGAVIVEMTVDTRGRVTDAHVVRGVPMLDQAALDTVRQWEFAPTSFNGTLVPVVMSATVNFIMPPEARGAAQLVDGVAPLRVGGNVGAPRRIRNVAPVYPPEAIAARVSGIVILEITIDTQGRVVAARVVRSIPLLDQAAIDAVRQWVYEPTLLNGRPVPLLMSVTVNFTGPA